MDPGPVVLEGDRVLRPAGPWTPTVHRLLRHLHARGVDWVPRPLALADDGREVLTALPGTVPAYPLPAWVWSDAVLREAGARLAALHEASLGFDATDAVWQLPVHEPVEVVCHNDLAPYNLVFDDARRVVGVIDWDTASPGPRAWDLAYLASRLVSLSAPGNPDALAGDLGERGRRLALLCRAYGGGVEPGATAATAVARLRELAELAATRAAAGDARVAPHVRLYREDADWVLAHLDRLG